MQRALVLGTRGSEPERVHCPSLFRSRSGRTWPVRLQVWAQVFPNAVGDQVFGVTNSQFLGAYAEYAIASAAMLSTKPARLALSRPLPFLWSLLLPGKVYSTTLFLEAGQKVVIHGAAGNVGAFAVQLARLAHLRSVATASTKDIEYVRALGADKVIDYQTHRFEDEVRDADAVLDLVGGDTQTRSFQTLRRGGRLISTVSKPDQDRAKQHGITAAFFLVDVTTERLREIATLIDRGELKTRIGTILPLADAKEAHMILDGRRAQQPGKIILSVYDPDRAGYSCSQSFFRWPCRI